MARGEGEGMGIVLGLVMIALGLLAASSWIASRSEDAGALIETLRPIQGWLGVIGAVTGLVFLVMNIFAIGAQMKAGALVGMVLALGGPILLAATGFLMGFGMISAMLASNQEAKEQADELYQNLAVYQIPLGLASVLVGIWTLIAQI